ncbi:diguanylate cyclase [Coralloluteibacterium thermophilus]|uniref:diguanylate cyclase n=1 Tax=Coralloluteibacterium thermophilum TaxID=2707049 RepID=A0ABV9NP02_9GAMM
MTRSAPDATSPAAKVLLVENSKIFRQMVSTAIREKLDLEVVACATLAEARAALARGDTFFLALTGLVLADGEAEDIVSLFVGHGLPMAVVTGVFDAEVRQRVVTRPIVDYVLKDTPGAVDYLVWLVRRLERNRRIAALVVDDARSAREHSAAMLRMYGFRVVEASGGAEALRIMAAEPAIRLVVCDHEMPGMTGVEFTRRLRTSRSRDAVAVIGVSSIDRASLVAEFLKSGANDFLHKPFSREEFFCRISQNVDNLELIGSLQDLATRDFLTGLANRRSLFERGQALFLQTREADRPLAVAMLDIDFFKKVNDSVGHDGGDVALKAVAGAVAQHAGPQDLAARLGGEEFCLLLPDRDAASAAVLLDGLRRHVEELAVPFEGGTIALTVSIGLCAGHRESLHAMLAEADRALYLAKAAGRNRLVAAEGAEAAG